MASRLKPLVWGGRGRIGPLKGIIVKPRSGDALRGGREKKIYGENGKGLY